MKCARLAPSPFASGHLQTVWGSRGPPTARHFYSFAISYARLHNAQFDFVGPISRFPCHRAKYAADRFPKFMRQRRAIQAEDRLLLLVTLAQ